MANLFISYNRESDSSAKDLIDDIKGLGHTVWFDQELSGGQIWWNRILETVRNCDIFVFILSSESLNSTACSLEYGYANDLGKTILPILVSEGVSSNLLPPALSKIQFVDFRKRDRDAILRLAKAFSYAPISEPLPDPLPLPPEAPLSYLGEFSKQIKKTDRLSYEEQSVLVVDLKRSLRDPENAKDARMLLNKLRNRRDLLANIAEEIDELLRHPVQTSKETLHEMPNREIQKPKLFWTSQLGIIVTITAMITVLTSLYFVYAYLTQKPNSSAHNLLEKNSSAEISPVIAKSPEMNFGQEKNAKGQEALTIIKKPDKTIAINPNSPNDVDYFFDKGYGFYSLKRYDEAIAAFDKAIAINPNYTNAYYNKGLALHNLKQYEEANTAFDKAIVNDPNDTDALNNKGLALEKLKRYDEAFIAYDKALAINPNYTNAIYNKGLALSKLKRYDEALAAFDKAISIKPNYINAFNNKGLVLESLKRYEEAIAAYDKAIAVNPNYTTALNNKGLALEKLKRYDEAITAFDKAIDINPNYTYAFYNKGFVLHTVKLYDEAITAFNKTIVINPNYTDAFYMKGLALYNLKRYGESITTFDKAIAIDSNYTDAINNKGLALSNLKRYDEAISAFDKAIAINPKYVKAFYNKGITLYDLKRYDEAIAAYDKAIAIKPNYTNAFYRKAYVYALQNNKEKLLASLKKAIGNNIASKEWTKTDEHFKEYWNDKDFKKLVEEPS